VFGINQFYFKAPLLKYLKQWYPLKNHRLKAGGLNNGLKVLFRAKLG
jgi:hypothetical protein